MPDSSTDSPVIPPQSSKDSSLELVIDNSQSENEKGICMILAQHTHARTHTHIRTQSYTHCKQIFLKNDHILELCVHQP